MCVCVCKNSISKGCIYLHMNNMPMFYVSFFFKPSSEQCYYVILFYPENYFQIKKANENMRKL